jgi:hypothetical protein
LLPFLRGEVNRVYSRNPDFTVDDLLIEAELEESAKREAPRIKPNLNAIPNAPRQRFDGGSFDFKTMSHSTKNVAILLLARRLVRGRRASHLPNPLPNKLVLLVPGGTYSRGVAQRAGL